MNPVEGLAAAHAVTYAIATTWAFGGQADWVRGPLVAWGCIGIALVLAGLLRQLTSQPEAVKWQWIVPVLLLNALVLAASLNPNLQEVNSGPDILLAATGGNAHWPSSARPPLARSALLQLDTMWAAGFSLTFITRRRLLRLVLLLLGANAIVLAVFGTVQKLLGASGLFFGLVPSPQAYFFASFVYHNHWGAYALLMLAVWIGLARRYARQHHARDIAHSPAMLAGFAVLVIAATIPLSGSRSSSILMLVLLGGATVQWAVKTIRHRRNFNESVAPLIVVWIAVAALAIGSIGYVGRRMITRRYELTVHQVTAARTNHFTDAREYVYRDTWRMFRDKPWFGWGMASYPYIFTLYNTVPAPPKFPVFFHDAHSDWLQALAEHGVIGATLLIAAVLFPALTVTRQRQEALVAFPLLGCGVLVIYGALEFPFGNYAVVLSWWICFFAAIQYARLGLRDRQRGAEQDSSCPSVRSPF